MLIFQKMQHFQTFLIPSDRFQIRFWKVQKKAKDHLNPNAENEKKYIQKLHMYRDFSCHGALFSLFWNVVKKLVSIANHNLKYHFDGTDIGENIQFSNSNIFCWTPL